MLATMRRRVPAASRIETVVNTHGNPDHCFGNQLVAGATIVASKEAAAEIVALQPAMMAGMEANWRELGDAGEFFHTTMGRTFDFNGIVVTVPTQTFERELVLRVGEKEVRLTHVGPAHTDGDIIAYVPAERVVYTGDILFHESHPIVWAGPFKNWVAACDLLLGLDVDVVVPGHGPITDLSAVHDLKGYLEYVEREARTRYDAGMSYEEAAADIALDAFAGWSDPERIVANVFALYREFAGGGAHGTVPELFAAMGRYRKRHDVHAG
jgi:glyoxylase-like metal-dependent hydrolase (beta-lactamase superfamily II)